MTRRDDEADWITHVQNRRRRAQRLAMEPLSVGLARKEAAAAREMTPTRTEPKEPSR